MRNSHAFGQVICLAAPVMMTLDQRNGSSIHVQVDRLIKEGMLKLVIRHHLQVLKRKGQV